MERRLAVVRKGEEAVIPVIEIPKKQELWAVSDLRPDENQAPRKMPPEKLKSLGESLLQRQKHPLQVLPDGMIVTGERRWRAAKLVGIKSLWCVVLDDLLQYEGEKLKSEIRSEQASENWHRGEEAGVKLSVYFAEMFKAQQLYYRTRTNEELLEEARGAGVVLFSKKVRRGQDETRWLTRMRKENSYYSLIAHKFSIMDKSGKPMATAVRKNILFKDRTSEKVYSKAEDTSVSQIEGTLGSEDYSDCQLKQIAKVQDEICSDSKFYGSGIMVRTVMRAIKNDESDEVIEKVKKEVRKGKYKSSDLNKVEDQDALIAAVKEEVEGKKKEETFDEYLKKVSNAADGLINKLGMLLEQVKESPESAQIILENWEVMESLLLLISTMREVFAISAVSQRMKKNNVKLMT